MTGYHRNFNHTLLMDPVSSKTAGKNGGGPDLGEYLRQEVYPRLSAKQVFTHQAHEFRESGDKWRGNCPWHESKSGTSFSVKPSSLLWNCAGGCGGGGPIQYLYRLNGGRGSPHGRDFVELVRQLCVMAGVPFPERELPPEQQERARRLETRRAILITLYTHCQGQLLANTREAVTAREYLLSRGLGPDQQKRLGLGLFTDPGALRQTLRRQGFTDQEIRESSAAVGPLVGYIVFPWFDDSGHPLTAYGRWPGKPPEPKRDGEKPPPKTYALPNPRHGGVAEECTKRSLLYLYRALRDRHQDDLILVEGVVDAAVAQAHGDTRVTACVAGVISGGQLQTLVQRKVKRVTVCLDPDKAGDQNVARNVHHLFGAGITAFVAPRLPEGQDPDEFILENGIEAWRQHVDGAIHGYAYRTDQLFRNGRGVARG